MRVLAVDPGSEESAWIVMVDKWPERFAKEPNADLLAFFRNDSLLQRIDHVVIEKVESFGMPVGVEIFETVFWTGRFAEAVEAHSKLKVQRIGRKRVKEELCGTHKAKDSNIHQALRDRYGGDKVSRGTRLSPGPLFGITGDVWSALAVETVFEELVEKGTWKFTS